MNQQLDNKAKQFRDEMDKWKTTANKLEEAIEKLKKERDFHRMHHKRVGQEKNKLLTDISILSIKSTILDIKKIQEKYEAYKPQAEEWQAKYEQARKEKVNLQLEKDKLQRKVSFGCLFRTCDNRSKSCRWTKLNATQPVNLPNLLLLLHPQKDQPLLPPEKHHPQLLHLMAVPHGGKPRNGKSPTADQIRGEKKWLILLANWLGMYCYDQRRHSKLTKVQFRRM